MVKKGYAGTATIIFNETILKDIHKVTTGMGDDEGDAEGRVITVFHARFILVNVYTPNSGDILKRLSYRTCQWDDKFADHVARMRQEHPDRLVIICGDLNVAHTDLDYFNHDNSRCKLQPGTTPQEQQSFQSNLLNKAGLKVLLSLCFICVWYDYHPIII